MDLTLDTDIGTNGFALPAGIPGLVGWWDASDLEAGAVSVWPDRLGNNLSLRQSIGAAQPVAGLDNDGHPIVYFDGASYMDGDNPSNLIDGADGGTIVMVVTRTAAPSVANIVFVATSSNTVQFITRISSTSNNRYRVNARMTKDDSQVSATTTYDPALGDRSWLIGTAERNNDVITYGPGGAVNTGSGLTDNPFTAVDAGFTLGGTYRDDANPRTDLFTGNVLSVMLYNRALSAGEVATLSSLYIEDRFGITV